MGTFRFHVSRTQFSLQEVNIHLKLVNNPSILEILLPEA